MWGGGGSSAGVEGGVLALLRGAVVFGRGGCDVRGGLGGAGPT